MLEVCREVLGRRKGRIDLASVLEQGVCYFESASLAVRIGVRGPPFGFQRLDRLARPLDERLDVRLEMLVLHASQDITARWTSQLSLREA